MKTVAYIYLISLLFDFRLKGYDEDSIEIVSVMGRLDDLWYSMTDDERDNAEESVSVIKR